MKHNSLRWSNWNSQKNFWRQVSPAKKRTWATGGHRLEHSMFWWKLQPREQGQLESDQPGQAGEHGPIHTNQDKHTRLSTGAAVSTPCSWKHTAGEQHVLSSCPSHYSVKNTQCFPIAQGSANLSDHVQAPDRTNTYSLNQWNKKNKEEELTCSISSRTDSLLLSLLWCCICITGKWPTRH